ncbi:flagellar type III secretion system pore protein FliP [Pseudobdellovibrio exovorus]|uniref:Flagellar biosynthetic protein FliP n=1 Tax=Pseudobdellovibrio exovorus JSS TaxID=1184267 RepID=M4V8P2_9BACT|nr:flagellar type III secretion system pore protein FliP [Pseudobdellovibrio exovorus]AGH94830.1 flagellar biosynthesis protein FliP [Pseudobdellovibrio exovorus JSS]
MRLAKLLLPVAILLMGSWAFAQVTLPTLNMGFQTTKNPTEVVNAIKMVMVLTVLTLAPAIMIMMTGFTRILIVLSFLRQAMGVQQLPPNQLLVGLSLFLTFFVMAPAFNEINQKAVQPYLTNSISQDQAMENALVPLRRFMFSQTRDQDLALFVKLGQIEQPKTRADVPTVVLVPAFIVSELKTAFMIGFIIFLPFLIIDILAASVLMAMGMMMVPPIVISLPFKIMLFVLVDGWTLLIGSMMKSFG